MNRYCYGINKVLDVKPLVSLFTKSMPAVEPILNNLSKLEVILSSQEKVVTNTHKHLI